MNEKEFLERWEKDSPMYDAWGDFVTSTICNHLKTSGKKLSSYLKQNPEHRVKNSRSLLDKAFYRINKSYDNPYEEIEDKVGCRFVVLLVEQIKEITDIIITESSWNYKECRHFHSEREKEPLLFTYQSVHYVVRCKNKIIHNGVTISPKTPCEIQIRTLLQHAYAELTHDAVYKSKTLVKPEVHRTVAKSMALIETTDDFFSDVNSRLISTVSENLNFQQQLDELYKKHIGLDSVAAQKSSIVVLDEFSGLITEELIGKLDVFIKNESYLPGVIRNGINENPFYEQSVIIFVYYLIKKKKNTLLRDWPLNNKVLEKLAVDTGVSLDSH
ncbi:(p)ppGpp synthetase [Salinivibrio sp. IB868]|uniref:GTP pyrophosphokinase n=1 Tax=unclassified Salinivibrio TaxID=2636825 RepID=UPI000985E1D4|nr:MULTISPECIES: (p)ppGpp synthetase [unclassified Salinivibrio]OOE65984.1 (p)ppGpp synthetase [Salinivibrio sp. IB868]OOE76709.1 (p)ppGpp synthetase [Salinivibrio sp. IB870]